ncbi:hypothetical protein ASF06_09995 [Agreia sp. Leaf244]|nr:hypothetical protein ASF06_09995 [Agreia sp. Leaf244]
MLVGISGFCGSEPLAVMIEVLLPLVLGVSPPVEQPVSTRALAAARARAPMPMRLIFNFPPEDFPGLPETPLNCCTGHPKDDQSRG